MLLPGWNNYDCVCENIPDAVYDSQAADYGNIYDKLESVYLRDGGKMHCRLSIWEYMSRDFLIKSSQKFDSHQRSLGLRNCTQCNFNATVCRVGDEGIPIVDATC